MPRSSVRRVRRPPRPLLRERGQASVELVAVVPVVLLVGLAVWALLAAAEAGILTANAARSGARAAAVGEDARAAARAALPAALRWGLEVDEHGPGGAVRVRVRVPVVLRRWGPRVRWEASARLPGSP